jgi:hypothetical protein
MLQKLIYDLKRLFPWSHSSGKDQRGAHACIHPHYGDLREIALITDAEGHVIYVEPHRECVNGRTDEAHFSKHKSRFSEVSCHLDHDNHFWGLVLSKDVHRSGFLERKRKAKPRLDTRLIRALIYADDRLGKAQANSVHSSKDPCKR